MRVIAPLFLAFLSGLTWAGQQGPLLTYTGYGAIRFGMRLVDAERAVGSRSHPQEPDTESESCRYVVFSKFHGVRFMVEDGHIVRADVEAQVPNALGLSVGMTFEEVTHRFRHVVVKPNTYVDGGHDLVFKPPSGPGEIVAEEYDGGIKSIRAGLLPAAGYVEGCL